MPTSPALVAYYRVSTGRQGRSGLGLEAQQSAVQDHAKRAGVPILAEYTEVESGRNVERPKLTAALGLARAERATLVVAKLDRLSRDTSFTLGVLQSGIGVRFLDLPDVGAEPYTTLLVVTIMAAFAQWEAQRISQRIREALAALKARHDGVAFWAHPQNLTDAHRRSGSKIGQAVYAKRCAEHRAAVRPVATELRTDRTLAETAAELNARGFRTRRGKPWTAGAVSKLLCAPDV